jgi:hypothetical protein
MSEPFPTTLPHSFYRTEDAGRRFIPTALTSGPWDPAAQHGGPPSALLARAIELHGAPHDRVVVRITVDLLRPIPIAPLTIECTPLRAGRRVDWIAARLSAADGEVAIAHAVRVRRADVAAPAPPPAPPLPAPESGVTLTFSFFRQAVGYHRAVDIRIVRGTWSAGPVTAWMRLRVPLVEGEPTTALQTVMAVADAGNGLSPVADFDRFAFINPDLTVHLSRPLIGEWVALAASSSASELGTGLVDIELADERGPLGRAAQSLVIMTR